MSQGSTVFVDVAKDIKPFEGELTIKSIDRKGNVHVYKTPNVITFDARIVMAHLLVGHNTGGYQIGYIAVGSDQTAPDRNDESLYQPVHNQAVASYNFPNGDTGQVEITATLDFISAANGETLREAGLLCLDEATLFARQVHGAIEKDASIQLQYIWRIIFT